MEWFIAVIAVVALGVAAMAAAGRMGQMSDEPVRDTFRPDLPDGPLSAEDLRGVRLGVTLRGYAMDQVDDLIARLATEIADRDAQLAALRGSGPPAGETVPAAPAGTDRDVPPGQADPDVPPAQADPDVPPGRSGDGAPASDRVIGEQVR
ncbi:MAG: DivIVA protein [Friedmanniella sp.]|nr:DivIVA protein [Friedmanniella sp.]